MEHSIISAANGTIISSTEKENYIITLPVRSSFFYYEGGKIQTEVSQLTIKHLEGLITGEGWDLYGSFKLEGKFSQQNTSTVNITKAYETYNIEIIASFKDNKLEGTWKYPSITEFSNSNKIEFEFDLQPMTCEVQMLNSSNKVNKNMFVDYLQENNNSSEYIGISYFNEGVEFLEGTEYGITHVIYQMTPYKNDKKYFTGSFDFDTFRFELKQIELEKL